MKKREIKNPVTGKTYKVIERKTSPSIIENIRTLWKRDKTKARKRYW